MVKIILYTYITVFVEEPCSLPLIPAISDSADFISKSFESFWTVRWKLNEAWSFLQNKEQSFRDIFGVDMEVFETSLRTRA